MQQHLRFQPSAAKVRVLAAFPPKNPVPPLQFREIRSLSLPQIKEGRFAPHPHVLTHHSLFSHLYWKGPILTG